MFQHKTSIPLCHDSFIRSLRVQYVEIYYTFLNLINRQCIYLYTYIYIVFNLTNARRNAKLHRESKVVTGRLCASDCFCILVVLHHYTYFYRCIEEKHIKLRLRCGLGVRWREVEDVCNYVSK